ncbi:TetR/AcrR family transcriptional regulator [Clostridium beijerinckii]|uniref:TetR/AcrR family transcriptional regulator n=2 Tax=Clostridiaceae TaxID=31979 RepID=UPI0004224248|nr:TetR family transcriptional regulator [Clostridium beijerinckii]POO92374.1 TetR/AcrR family transcriptional regulator [Clostridium sp. 2-1]MBN7573431.1 TetR/AcrR family transcriptional regulator [Clostridium beijerinckii]MBN7578768.1 TetR/AcrR family transcriptional regulator [Clostridium beijerinckii]MBN7583204.1 TetR/AcrR family transcriptional regulator [Clostridium beijerinckii]MBO0519358.1 TetR/AcrR family transcriptional regulator [Clostridium beijerinckii]
MNENDLRVIKTKRNIEESFIYLLGQKDFYKITVQDILDKALINRSTFYKHYADKYKLAETLCNEVFDLLKTGVKDRFDCANVEDAIMVIKPLYHILSVKREEILALFTIHTDTIHLYDDMSNFLKRSFYDQYETKNKKSPEILDYISDLYAALVMTAIKWCLKNDGYEELTSHTQLVLKLAEVFDYPCK